MKKIGVLFGMENSFPGALVQHINERNVEGIQAEFVETGAVHLSRTPRYAVIVDRISHDIPFYRAFLKHAALNGTVIINNPFWWSADDKFFNYTLAEKLGVTPASVMLVEPCAQRCVSARTEISLPVDAGPTTIVNRPQRQCSRG